MVFVPFFSMKADWNGVSNRIALKICEHFYKTFLTKYWEPSILVIRQNIGVRREKVRPDWEIMIISWYNLRCCVSLGAVSQTAWTKETIRDTPPHILSPTRQTPLPEPSMISFRELFFWISLLSLHSVLTMKGSLSHQLNFKTLKS